MQNSKFFIVLLTLITHYNCVYSMMRLPATASNIATVQASGLAKYIPGYTITSTTPTQTPQIRLSPEQLDILAKDIVQDLEQSTIKPWTSYKTSTGFKASSDGMFKTTQPMLMQWTYKESPQSVLGVSNNPTEAELKSAHKAMVMKYHPDRGGKPEDFRKIQEAYEYLKYVSSMGQKYSSNQYGQTSQDQQYQQTYSYQQQNAGGR